MKLQKPKNDNYQATVVSIHAITPLEGSDNIVGTPLQGFKQSSGRIRRSEMSALYSLLKHSYRQSSVMKTIYTPMEISTETDQLKAILE